MIAENNKYFPSESVNNVAGFNILSYKSTYIPKLFSSRLQRIRSLGWIGLPPLAISFIVQVYQDRGRASCLSSCMIRAYTHKFITYWGILETFLLISRLSTWLPPTVSISLLKFSLRKTSLFSQWGYFAGRFPFFVCQLQHLAHHGVGCLWIFFFLSLFFMCQRVLDHAVELRVASCGNPGSVCSLW